MSGRVVSIVLVLTSAAAAQPPPVPEVGPAPATEEGPGPAVGPATSSGPPSETAPAGAPVLVPEPREPPRRERFAFGLGGVLGSGPRYWLWGAWTAEAAVAVLQAPVRVRARAFGNLVGGAMQSDWSGRFTRYGGGVELRGCVAEGRTCGFVDVDFGHQAMALRDGGEVQDSVSGLFVGPRLGVDLGGRLRFRAAFERYWQITNDSFRASGLSIGLAYQR